MFLLKLALFSSSDFHIYFTIMEFGTNSLDERRQFFFKKTHDNVRLIQLNFEINFQKKKWLA